MIELAASEILRQVFLDGLYVSLPNAGSGWPCFATHLPDGDRAVDNAICIYDELPEKDGRHMNTGEVVLHYTVQILLRTNNQSQGWLKLSQLANYLDSLANKRVTVNGDSFILLSATQRTGVDSLGVEADEPQRRWFFDTRYALSIREI